MNKLKEVIKYECITSFKYIWIFYGIEFLVYAFLTLISTIITDNSPGFGGDCIEINTLIYVGVLGVLGYTEDFKSLIQNGFTRKYIFIATITLFAFMSGIMSLFDTVMGNLIVQISSNYTSFYSTIYGHGNILVNWLWLFLLYMFVCSLFYLIVLVINKVGKKKSVYLGIITGGLIIVIVSLINLVFSNEIITFILTLLGLMNDGSINMLMPLLTFSLLTAFITLCYYKTIRRIELK